MAETMFKILAVASEYRTYTVWSDSEDEAQAALVAGPEIFEYERGDDTDDPLNVVEVWEA